MKLNITKTDQKHSPFRRRTELSRSGEAEPKSIGFCAGNQLFVGQRSTANYYTPYKFSGKEKDEETSYSYFGARYYMSDVSVWLSVDPLKENYPNLSSYMYCIGNPIKYIDPDGKRVIIGNLNSATKKILKSYSIENFGTSKLFKIDRHGEMRIRQCRFDKFYITTTNTSVTFNTVC